MKVLLIEPNIEGYALMPSISLATLKAFINEKTKHQAKIVDLIFNKKNWKEYLRKEINDENPNLIGLSVLSFNINQALKISSFIKENYKIKVIFGGVHSILAPEEVIENEQVDFVCTGEGEYVLKELLDKKLNCEEVNGIFYKKNGKIIQNPLLRTISELDELPFPNWEDFNLEKYFIINNNHLPIMASRGCPYKCTYCSNHALKKKLLGKYIRCRSTDNVIEEIELRIKQYFRRGMKYLFFYDDTFILNKTFVFEFCKKFKEKGFDKLIRWNANVRANLVSEDIIKAMKKAGCYEVRMGVEAGNDYIRNGVYKRGMSEEQIFKAIRIIKEQGLQLRLQFIIGAPYETSDMMRESFEMAKKSGADYILFPILMPLPETEIKEMCEKEGLIEEEGFKNSYTMFTHPVSKTKYASKKDIKKIVNKIRMYQMKKYMLEGFFNGGPLFLWDILTFFCYYKPKYSLELENAFRFTINKYKLKKLEKDSYGP